jgi:hypothetical protein
VSRVASAAWTPAAPAHRQWAFVAFLILGSVTTVAATIVGNGDLAVAVAPVILTVLLAATWVAPLRLPLLAVIFLSLALDAAGEGPWDSPLAPIGKLLAINLNKSLPIPALMLPGVAIILLLLLLVHAHRGLAHLRTDIRDRAPSADVLPLVLGVSFCAAVWVCLYGIKTGGDAQMAKIQVQSFVMTLIVAYLAAASLRGMRDYRTIGGIIVFSACVKSVMAVYVAKTVPPSYITADGQLNYAITHGESLLFAAAAVLLVVRLFEMPSRRAVLAAVGLLPLLLLGMSANNRRLVYVEVAGALLLYWLVSRRSPVKRLAAYTALACLPVLVGYVATGWNSQSKIFAPVKIFRSVGDSDVDHSTLYRDLENYNLLATMRFNPVLGPGLGHQFAEVVKLPDISFAFKEYRYMPHNSLLGLWAFCGPIGFTGLMLTPVVGMYLAAIAYRAAAAPADRIAAFMVQAMILIFLIHCWGDIGFSERKAIYLVGPALGIAAQLAVTTGAWPMRRRRT